MRFIETSIPGVFVIEPVIFEDQRGFFLETYHYKRYAGCGIDKVFVQDNRSYSRHGVLRGLHYQLQHPQGKLIYVATGEVYDVVVDIRRGSPGFGQWVGVSLSAKNGRQIFVPEGLAHGFCVLSEEGAGVIYKCTDFYDPADECGILWSDPTIGIDWPIKRPILSPKDCQNPRLNDIPETRFPIFDAMTISGNINHEIHEKM